MKSNSSAGNEGTTFRNANETGYYEVFLFTKSYFFMFVSKLRLYMSVKYIFFLFKHAFCIGLHIKTMKLSSNSLVESQ